VSAFAGKVNIDKTGQVADMSGDLDSIVEAATGDKLTGIFRGYCGSLNSSATHRVGRQGGERTLGEHTPSGQPGRSRRGEMNQGLLPRSLPWPRREESEWNGT
jgi:hypothetical protein